jgi:hypothetical protein
MPPRFDPELVFEALGDDDASASFPPWLFSERTGMFFAEFQELSLQLCLEVARSCGVFDSFDVYNSFSFLENNPLRKTERLLRLQPMAQWAPFVQAKKTFLRANAGSSGEMSEARWHEEESSERASYATRSLSFFSHLARSVLVLNHLANCVAFLAAGHAVLDDGNSALDEMSYGRRKLERESVTDALRVYLDDAWVEESPKW